MSLCGAQAQLAAAVEKGSRTSDLHRRVADLETQLQKVFVCCRPRLPLGSSSLPLRLLLHGGRTVASA